METIQKVGGRGEGTIGSKRYGMRKTLIPCYANEWNIFVLMFIAYHSYAFDAEDDLCVRHWALLHPLKHCRGNSTYV